MYEASSNTDGVNKVIIMNSNFTFIALLKAKLQTEK